MKRPSYILLIIFLINGLAGFSQQARVSAKLDTNAMLIGDHVGLTLKYSGPSQAQLLWPMIPDTILGNISVIGRGKIDTAYTADKKEFTLSQSFSITCYDSGFYTIPPIPFDFRVLPDTTTQSLTTQLLTLMVNTVKVDTTQAIKPIAGPLRVPITFREMLPWILIALAAILLIGFGLWYYQKRKKKQPVFRLKPTVVIPPHELALKEMEKLRVKKLWQSGKIKEYHSELTEILRRYIENRFKTQALEQTSDEIIDSLKSEAAIPGPVLDKLRHLLVRADLVKFAKSLPLPAENEQSLTDGIEFVYETTGTKKEQVANS